MNQGFAGSPPCPVSLSMSLPVTLGSPPDERPASESLFRVCLGGPHPKTWRRPWQPTPVLLPGKSHGWRSLVGCSPWGHEESDTTEQLHFHFSLSCIGEGNGNPLQCSCLENPRDGGAWWAAIYGVAQSRTRLKRLSSSSSKQHYQPARSNGHLLVLYSIKGEWAHGTFISQCTQNTQQD